MEASLTEILRVTEWVLFKRQTGRERGVRGMSVQVLSQVYVGIPHWKHSELSSPRYTVMHLLYEYWYSPHHIGYSEYLHPILVLVSKRSYTQVLGSKGLM